MSAFKTKDYWELTRLERGSLTDEEFASFQDYELMRAGVVRPMANYAVHLTEKVELPEPDLEVYCVKTSDYSSSEIAWQSAEAAARSFGGAVGVVRTVRFGSYPNEVSVKEVSFDSLPTKTEVEFVRAYSSEALAKHREEIESSAARLIEAGKEKAAFNEQMDAVNKALLGMVSDRAQCSSELHEVLKMEKTMAEYVEMTDGDVETAKKFLKRAFNEDMIELFDQYTAAAKEVE